MFLHFHPHGNYSRRFVYIEQAATTQLGEIDFFCEFRPKKMTSMVHHSFATSDHQILTQAPRYSVFLIRAHNLRSNTKI